MIKILENVGTISVEQTLKDLRSQQEFETLRAKSDRTEDHEMIWGFYREQVRPAEDRHNAAIEVLT